MAKVVGEVAIDVTADIGPLVTAMKRGKSAMDGLKGAAGKAARGMEAFGNKASSLGASLTTVTAGITAAAGAAFVLTRNVAGAGDAAAKAARGAGVSGEYFQEMAFAMDQVAAISSEELASGMTRVTRMLGEAQQGSKSAIAAFEQIGISQADIVSGSVGTEQAFDTLVKKLSETKDPALAAAIAMDLLGRGGVDLGPKLAGSAGEIAKLRDRAHELGIVMSDDALNASEKFGDQLDEVAKGFEGLKVAIANELLPVFVNVLLPAMVDKVIPALQSMVGSIGDVIEWFAALPAPVQEAAGAIAVALGVGGPVLMAIGAVSLAISAMIAATGPVGLFAGAAIALGIAWTKWGDNFKAGVGGAIDWVSGKFEAFLALMQTVLDKAIAIKAAVAEALMPGASFGENGTVKGSGAKPDLGEGFGIGQDLGRGMIGGLGQSITDGEAELRGYIDQVPAIARDQLGVHSPSRVFHEIGQFLGVGMANGIAESSGLVADAAANMGRIAVAQTDASVSGVLGSMGQLFQGSKKISAGIAVANSWLAFTEVLKDPSFVGRPFARIAAATSAAAAGLNAVKNIKSAQIGGTSSGGASASSASSAPQSVANITLVGDTFSRGTVEDLFTQINEGLRQGRVINLVRA